MQIRHDPEHNIAYIRFRPKGEQVETIEISSELNIDLAPNGELYGIELLNANEQLTAEGGVLQWMNLSTNQLRELAVN